MGAWGSDSFENDNACDYAAEVADGRDLSRLEGTLDQVLRIGSDLLESPLAEEGLAAADIVARLKGSFGQQDAYTERVDQWARQIKLSPSNNLVEKARRAVDRVLIEPCELLELWSDGEDLESWRTSVSQLLSRL